MTSSAPVLSRRSLLAFTVLATMGCSDPDDPTSTPADGSTSSSPTQSTGDTNDTDAIDTLDTTGDTSIDDTADSTSTTGMPNEREHISEEGVEFVEANGQQFGYFAEGEGPLVLLLHGFPDTPHTWDDLRPAIAAEGYRVVTPFLRGYAPSTFPGEDDYGPQTLGEDVIALVEALGETQAHVVGHDWGAFSAYAAVSLEPDVFLSMTTLAIPHPGFFVPDPEFFERATHFIYLAQDDAEDLMRADDYAHVDELYARWSPTWDVPEGETEAVKNAFAASGSLDATLGYYRAASPAPPPFLQVPIDVPSTTIAGIDDGVALPDTFDQTAAGFTGPFTLHKFPGGHFVHRESPDEVLEAILEQLESAS